MRQKITIKPRIIIDLVKGANVDFILFLFDKQNLNIDTTEHPKSNSLKPGYETNKTAYHAVIYLR